MVGERSPRLVTFRDKQRRKSKWQRDLADVLRVVETHPELKGGLPPEIESQVEQAWKNHGTPLTRAGRWRIDFENAPNGRASGAGP